MDRDKLSGADLALVARIRSGSESAWHEFVEAYSPLLLSVLQRHLYDEEDSRNLWASLLAKLRNGLLESYEGRAKLSTWLTLVARSAAIDELRRRRGRRKAPEGLNDLPERERFVFREIFQRGRTPEEVRLALSTRPELRGEASYEEIIGRLEGLVGERAAERVAWDLHAKSVGQSSGQLLEYMHHVALQAEERQEDLSPDRAALHEQTRRTLDKVREALEALPADEKRILEMRFFEGWTAPRIQDELGLGRQREVYTRINRALRQLRRKLGLESLGLWLGLLVNFFW